MTLVESTDKTKFMTVRTTSFEPAGEGGSASVEKIGAKAEVTMSNYKRTLQVSASSLSKLQACFNFF